MYIRMYRKPIESTPYTHIEPGVSLPLAGQFKEVFVLMEKPLLEMDHEDLIFLKLCGVSVTTY